MVFINRSSDREPMDTDAWERRQQQIRTDIQTVGASCALHLWRDRLLSEKRLEKPDRPISILIPKLLQGALNLKTQEVLIGRKNSITTCAGIVLVPAIL